MARRGPPIDRGWAWAIAAGMFLECFINGGFIKSYGVFFSAFSDTFGRSASETQLVRSVRSACATLTGPLSTALSERFTERAVVIAGALVTSLGFILAFFAESLEMLIFTFGIFAGVGVSLFHGPSQVCLGRYFEKKRGRANSLALVGTAIGQIAVPPLISFLMTTYSLRGTMLIYGGIYLNVVITGAVMRPLGTNIYGNQDSPGNSKRVAFDSEPVQPSDSNSRDCNSIPVDVYHTENKCETNAKDGVKDRDASHVTLVDCDFKDVHLKNTVGLHSVTDNVGDTGYLHTVNKSSQGDVFEQKVDRKIPALNKTVCTIVISFLKDIFDLDVLTNPLYILFIVCTSFSMIAVSNQLTFIVARAEECGVSREMAAILLSIIGGCDVVGRLLLGVLADVKCLASHHVMAVGVALTSISMYAFPFARTFPGMAIIAVIYGIIGSTDEILNLPVMVKFVGKDLLAKAIGMSILFYGGFMVISAPLIGLVKDRSGSFSAVFYVTASLQLFAAILLVTLEPLARRKYIAQRTQLTIQPPET